MIFIDCEFTQLKNPELLSIGMVADSGESLYIEISDQAIWAKSSDFVVQTVLPQFGHVGQSVVTQAELGQLVGRWLDKLPPAKQFNVVYDYHADFDLLEQVLRDAGLWARFEKALTPNHVGYMLGHELVEGAMAHSWMVSHLEHGLERHHALADALALKAGFDAMRRPPNGAGELVLFLDFDGVLHQEDWCWSRKGPFIKARSLGPTPYSVFQHVGPLEEILAPYPQVKIVLSTSWVRSYGCSGAAKRMKSESLSARVIGATFHSMMDVHAFLVMPRGLQIWRDAERRKPLDWLAIDGDHQDWPTSALDHYDRTHAADGISEPQVRLERENKLALMCSKTGIRL